MKITRDTITRHIICFFCISTHAFAPLIPLVHARTFLHAEGETQPERVRSPAGVTDVLSTTLPLPQGAPQSPNAPGLSAQEILKRVLDLDPWGLVEAEVTARVVVRDAAGLTRELSFTARSKRWAPQLSKSLVRFTRPADVAGVSFLQIQRKDGDDDRYLFLPELKRSKRIAGDLRGNAFMGTDFSYGDLDRRELREARAHLSREEIFANHPCSVLDVTPTSQSATYTRVVLWVRKDTFVPLKILMYNRAGVLVKTLTTHEMRRIGGRWFITRSVMQNHELRRQTELTIEKIIPKTDIPDDEFTVRNLEKV